MPSITDAKHHRCGASLNPNKLRRRFFTSFKMTKEGAEWQGEEKMTFGTLSFFIV